MLSSFTGSSCIILRLYYFRVPAKVKGAYWLDVAIKLLVNVVARVLYSGNHRATITGSIRKKSFLRETVLSLCIL